MSQVLYFLRLIALSQDIPYNIMSRRAEPPKNAAKRAKKQAFPTSLAATLPCSSPSSISCGGSNSTQTPYGILHASTEESTPSNNEEIISSRKEGRRKGRGKAKLTNITRGCKVGVTFNERGQPIGENSQKLVSCLGILAREIIPITLENWDNMTIDMAQGAWDLVQENFIVPDCYRKQCFSMMRKMWAEYKSRVTKELLAVREDPHAISLMKPDNVKSMDEWNNFVKSRLSDEFAETRAKFKNMRAKQKMPHTTSRKGYARLEAEMRLESKTPNSVSRVDVWIKGHLKKDNTPLNEEIGETVRKLQECSEESQATRNLRDDALTRVLGQEHQGRVRGLGFGATISMVNACASQDDRERRYEAQIQEMKREFDDQVKSQTQRLEAFESELQQMKSLLAQFTEGTVQGAVPSSTSNLPPPADVEGHRCEILHWLGTGEVVAVGEVASTDPAAKVDGQLQVGPECWKIFVNRVYKRDVPLYRATPCMFYLQNAKRNTVAWPSNCVRLTGA